MRSRVPCETQKRSWMSKKGSATFTQGERDRRYQSGRKSNYWMGDKQRRYGSSRWIAALTFFQLIKCIL
jgi:putative salt-induced outer membrane protein YdiY